MTKRVILMATGAILVVAGLILVAFILAGRIWSKDTQRAPATTQVVADAKAEAETKVKTEAESKAKAETEAKARAEAESKVFANNMGSWAYDPLLEDPAQLKLAPEYERVVRRLIQANFTSHDAGVVEATSRKIWEIAGDRATAIVLEYTNDPRVVVAENAKLWYKNYSPKAVMNKIEAPKPKTPTAPAVVPPTPAKPRISVTVDVETSAVTPKPASDPTGSKLSATNRELIREIDNRIWQQQHTLASCQHVLADSWKNRQTKGQEMAKAACDEIEHDLVNLRQKKADLMAGNGPG